MRRYAARRDANEADIVLALERCGCDVLRATDVDLIVGCAGKSWLFEVKRPGRTSESRLRPIQRRLRDEWRGQYDIITSAEEALRIMGLNSLR